MSGAIRSFRPTSTLARLVMASLTVGLVTVAVLPIQAASASTVTVTNCNDSGAGSLRNAISGATSGATINFALSPPCSTITLASSVDINKNLTITGPGAKDLAVSGNNAVGVFFIVNAVTIAISGLTIEKGNSSAGGGIEVGGTLNLSDSTMSGNAATNGGAISNAGTLNVRDSTFSGNTATGTGHGGALFSGSGSTANLADSTVSGNTAMFGGGIYADGNPITVTASTLSGNNASGGGGGIMNQGRLNLTNSTLSNNGTAAQGGGIWNDGGTLSIASSTLSGNNASGGGGGTSNSGSETALATILANSSGHDCSGGITDEGYNIDDDGSCGLTSPSIRDSPTLDSTLGALASNGGPTQTIALLPNNPGIDKVVPVQDCPATDQRGNLRKAPCDIGAYDTDACTTHSVDITTPSLPPATPGDFYSARLTAACGNSPYKWKLAKGSAKLPKGLKLNHHTGLIKGTPKKNAKSSTFTVEVLDKKVKVKHHHATQNTATKVLSITIT